MKSIKNKILKDNEVESKNDTLYEIGKKIPYTGRVTSEYIDGSLWYELSYKNGHLHGKYRLYYENSNIEMEGNFKDDNQHGVWKYYHKTGKLHKCEKFIEGIRSGAVLEYYPEGTIQKSTKYKNDDTIGKEITYFPNGKIQEVIKHIGKSINRIQYSENGDILSKVTVKDGVYHGHYIQYHINQQIKVKGYFKEGNKIGVWYYYYSNGKIRFIEKYNYKKGSCKIIEYDKDGKIIDNLQYEIEKINYYK
ncbi:toxin-antitoxin system YwqK family antitoxin [Fusobacterium sp. PH5-44]|uniref:toxin-antitoxin system YwqK family antitoxin n=1 Tax=unclassified Fusobacterium TaxID=2648384 RepID=UPI003D1BAF07